jgi:hypothetical protein
MSEVYIEGVDSMEPCALHLCIGSMVRYITLLPAAAVRCRTHGNFGPDGVGDRFMFGSAGTVAGGAAFDRCAVSRRLTVMF